jgi:rhamnogalacturonyl hydrolase YesR
MADWLISIQLSEGAFQGGFVNEVPKPIVFNTGQVLQGLLNIYKETTLKIYLEAANRAAEWLISIQDKDGAWRAFTYNNVPHVYKTRVSWPLLELHELTSEQKYIRAASKNIEWVLGNQDKNGWFRNNAFDSKTNPFLHTVAYAIEGLLECASLTGNKEWLESAIRPAEALLDEMKLAGTLSGVYNNEWKGTVKYRCLTGEAQMCVCWLRLFQLTGDCKWKDAAQNVSIGLKRLQNTTSDNRGIRGGVKGSHPIWGGYLPFAYPNWAAKFFADALMLEKKLIPSACA